MSTSYKVPIYNKDTKIQRFCYLRGIIGFFCNVTWFMGVTLLPLGDAASLIVTSPIMVLILAFIILREKVTAKQAVYCCVSFLGAIFISKPTFLKSILGLEIEQMASD